VSKQDPPTAIDVCGEEAFRADHIAGARNTPGDDWERHLAQFAQKRLVIKVFSIYAALFPTAQSMDHRRLPQDHYGELWERV
jgi:hypothetical protein